MTVPFRQSPEFKPAGSPPAYWSSKNCAHWSMSLRHLAKASPRMYACCTESPKLWANAASAACQGVLVSSSTHRSESGPAGRAGRHRHDKRHQLFTHLLPPSRKRRQEPIACGEQAPRTSSAFLAMRPCLSASIPSSRRW